MKTVSFVILVVVIMSVSAQAKPFKYSGGSGTAEDPYIIAIAGDLTELSSNIDDYDANFIVTADINLSSYTGTTAVIARDIDNSDWIFDGDAFTGIFDGDGHTISNLTINTGGAGNDFLGLFGCIDGGEMKNLDLENVRIIGGNTSAYVGCLIGGNYSGTISNCRSTGDVRSGTPSECVGGLMGLNYSGNISNCSSSGFVKGQYSVGGLVGLNEKGSDISKCFSTCGITGDVNSTSIGGLVGDNYEKSNISNSYSTGNVSSGKNTMYLGGLVGSSEYDTSISNCYSTGILGWGGSSSFIGGLVGLVSHGGVLSGCYFDYTISGPANGYGEPLTDAQMKQQASFVGWDFAGETKNGKEDIWSIEEGIDYPRLNWVKVFKCTVTAGKDNKDKIVISGKLDTAANYYFTNGNAIEITVKSDHMPNYWDHYFEITNENFKNGKLNYNLNSVKGFKTSFKYDTKTRKFAYSAGNVDLSGLDCSVTFNIHIGDYRGSVDIDEDIVNGKRPAPMILMMGVKNSLRVDSIEVKQVAKPSSDQLTVKGGFAVEDTNIDMAGLNLDITLSGEPYTIEAGKLKPSKYYDRFTCSKLDMRNGIAYIDFNFKTCRFKITIKGTEIDDGYQGDVDFGIMFGDFEESADVFVR
jgi:hypothetical protein